jgi:hypothetical protein
MPYTFNPFTNRLDFYEASSGGTVTSVSGTANRITVTNPTTTPVIDIAATYVGQTSITTLGTISTGVWNGTAVDATHGGTAQTTYAAGDILYASATNVLSKLPKATDTNVLTLVGGLPSWQAAGGGGSSTTFFAYVNTSIVNPTGDGTPYTVIFDSTLNNTGSAYSTGTGLFTAPATGIYHFDTCIAFNAVQSTSTTVVIQFNGSAVSVRGLQFQGATTALVEGLTCYDTGITVPMTAGDTMSVLVNVGGVAKNVSLFGSGTPAGAATVFTGYRVS